MTHPCYGGEPRGINCTPQVVEALRVANRIVKVKIGVLESRGNSIFVTQFATPIAIG